MPGADVMGSRRGRPLLLMAVGPPLRMLPLLGLPRASVVLAFTDDAAECAVADIVLLSDPPVGDVVEVREHAIDTPLLVIVPRGTGSRRLARLQAAGADLCLADPDADELVPHVERLDSTRRAAPIEGEG